MTEYYIDRYINLNVSGYRITLAYNRYIRRYIKVRIKLIISKDLKLVNETEERVSIEILGNIEIIC